MNVIIIAGMPASGKSTVSAKVSQAFGYPILEKDALKEAIFDTMGFSCYAEKRKTDHAANSVLLCVLEALLRADQSVILDNNFDTDSAKKLDELIVRYDCRCVIVFLDGDADIFYRRYVERDRRHVRHPGHVVQEHYPLLPGETADHDMTREEFREKFAAFLKDQVRKLS